MAYLVSDGHLVLTLTPDEGGGFVVTSPQDADLLTQADTVEEAFANALDLIALLAEYRAAKKE